MSARLTSVLYIGRDLSEDAIQRRLRVYNNNDGRVSFNLHGQLTSLTDYRKIDKFFEDNVVVYDQVLIELSLFELFYISGNIETVNEDAVVNFRYLLRDQKVKVFATVDEANKAYLKDFQNIGLYFNRRINGSNVYEFQTQRDEARHPLRNANEWSDFKGNRLLSKLRSFVREKNSAFEDAAQRLEGLRANYQQRRIDIQDNINILQTRGGLNHLKAVELLEEKRTEIEDAVTSLEQNLEYSTKYNRRLGQDLRETRGLLSAEQEDYNKITAELEDILNKGFSENSTDLPLLRTVTQLENENKIQTKSIIDTLAGAIRDQTDQIDALTAQIERLENDDLGVSIVIGAYYNHVLEDIDDDSPPGGDDSSGDEGREGPEDEFLESFEFSENSPEYSLRELQSYGVPNKEYVLEYASGTARKLLERAPYLQEVFEGSDIWITDEKKFNRIYSDRDWNDFIARIQKKMELNEIEKRIDNLRNPNLAFISAPGWPGANNESSSPFPESVPNDIFWQPATYGHNVLAKWEKVSGDKVIPTGGPVYAVNGDRYFTLTTNQISDTFDNHIVFLLPISPSFETNNNQRWDLKRFRPQAQGMIDITPTLFFRDDVAEVSIRARSSDNKIIMQIQSGNMDKFNMNMNSSKKFEVVPHTANTPPLRVELPSNVKNGDLFVIKAFSYPFTTVNPENYEHPEDDDDKYYLVPAKQEDAANANLEPSGTALVSSDTAAIGPESDSRGQSLADICEKATNETTCNFPCEYDEYEERCYPMDQDSIYDFIIDKAKPLKKISLRKLILEALNNGLLETMKGKEREKLERATRALYDYMKGGIQLGDLSQNSDFRSYPSAKDRIEFMLLEIVKALNSRKKHEGVKSTAKSTAKYTGAALAALVATLTAMLYGVNGSGAIVCDEGQVHLRQDSIFSSIPYLETTLEATDGLVPGLKNQVCPEIVMPEGHVREGESFVVNYGAIGKYSKETNKVTWKGMELPFGKFSGDTRTIPSTHKGLFPFQYEYLLKGRDKLWTARKLSASKRNELLAQFVSELIDGVEDDTDLQIDYLKNSNPFRKLLYKQFEDSMNFKPILLRSETFESQYLDLSNSELEARSSTFPVMLRFEAQIRKGKTWMKVKYFDPNGNNPGFQEEKEFELENKFIHRKIDEEFYKDGQIVSEGTGQFDGRFTLLAKLMNYCIYQRLQNGDGRGFLWFWKQTSPTITRETYNRDEFDFMRALPPPILKPFDYFPQGREYGTSFLDLQFSEGSNNKVTIVSTWEDVREYASKFDMPLSDLETIVKSRTGDDDVEKGLKKIFDDWLAARSQRVTFKKYLKT